MRKSLLFFVLMTLVISVASAGAELPGRKVFAVSGKFIEFIPFPFTVNSGNCNNVKVSEYEQGYYYPTHTYAHWQTLASGDVIKSYSAGYFLFEVDGTACSPEVVVEGPIFDIDVYGTWSGLDIQVNDIGLFVKGVEVATNYFNLSSAGYNYVLVFPPYGRKYVLEDLIKFADGDGAGIHPSGSTLVGAIISDERGFFNKIIFDPINPVRSARKLKNQSKNIIMYDDQPVVLIFKY